jgi:hypothetical protein
MLTPSMGYEVGKGRIWELERKVAAQQLLDEALATPKPQHAASREGLLARVKHVTAALAHLGHRSRPTPASNTGVAG